MAAAADALAQRLALLRRQAGQGVAGDAARPLQRQPSPGHDPEAVVAQLRRLLKSRALACGAASATPGAMATLASATSAGTTPAAAPASPPDRRIDGTEIAPGLFQHEAWVPWPRGDDLLPLHGIGFDAIARERLLAFDTETTGLAGGTGTRAFMIGAADWRDGGLRLRQLTIATLGAEPAMLKAFKAWLAPETVLVSYNGRSYDRPLLSTRYRLARLVDPLPALRHVDLLHPVRRRYRGVWENCRLATIERELLGVVREDDLPGREAPAAWLSFLRGGDALKLRRVGEHNAQDLRSLCQLLERMADDAG